MEEVAWLDLVEPITEPIVPVGLTSDDIGDGDACVCHEDCFADASNSAKMAIYCATDCCRLNAKCSDAPCTHPGLKLFNTYLLGWVCTQRGVISW
ncbi:hypothetical protein DVH05_009146 [Phytophthora capsici]|nr:hypothetical protein DVH05_009146 [Phytophthora capsici]